MKLALTFYSVLKMPIQDILACAAEAERARFDCVSVAESFYRDGFALGSAIAAGTKTIKLGTSIMPIYTRTPFQLAMGAATLHESSGGRVAFLGLGIGYRQRTESYFGIEQTSRIERMAEYVELLRKLLTEEHASFHGKFFQSKGFPRPSAEPLEIPVYLGCSGPRMLELAGRTCDGVILNSLSTPEYLAWAKRKIAEGAEKAGGDPSKIVVGHSVVYSCAEDTQKAREAAMQDILFYISYPELDPILRMSEFAEQARRIRGLNERGEKEKALSLISEQMLETFAVWGTPNQCRTKLRSFVRRGIDLPIIRVSTSYYPESERRMAYFAAIRSLRS